MGPSVLGDFVPFMDFIDFIGWKARFIISIGLIGVPPFFMAIDLPPFLEAIDFSPFFMAIDLPPFFMAIDLFWSRLD